MIYILIKNSNLHFNQKFIIEYMIRNKKTQNWKRKKMGIIQVNEDKMLSQKIVLFLPKRHFIQISWLNKLQIQKRDTKFKKKIKEKKQRNIKENHESVVAEKKKQGKKCRSRATRKQK